MARRIRDDEVDHFQRHGFVVIERFLDEGEIARSLAEVDRLFATGVAWAAGERRDQPLLYARPLGPLPSRLLNTLVVHPHLCDFGRRALEIDDPVVVQSGLYAKYQSTSSDQELHVDYRNNELIYPSRQRRYHQISMMLYHDAVTDDNAPTCLVSRTRTESLFLHPASWSREQRPELYAHETRAVCPPGSILAWDMRTVHRGSFMRQPQGRRVHTGVVLASASARWIGMGGWGIHGSDQDFRQLVVDAGREGLALLGFPPPGHDYWDEETIAGAAARYPDLDLAEHRQALARQAALAATPA